MGPRLVLRDAVAELARMPQDGAVEEARNGGASVHQDESDGPPNGGVGAVSGAEEVVPAVDAEGGNHGAVDDDEDAGAAEAGGGAYKVEGGIEHGFGGGEDDWEVFRLAAGHDGVGGNFADGYFAATFGQFPDDFVGGPIAGGEELLDALHGWRDNGQAVGPTQCIALLDGLDRVVPLSLDKRT